MSQAYAADGSQNATVVSFTDSGKGTYAADGSLRVTITGIIS